MSWLTSLMIIFSISSVFFTTYDYAYPAHESSNPCATAGGVGLENTGACHAIIKKQVLNYGNQYSVTVADQLIEKNTTNDGCKEINSKAVTTQWIRFENFGWIEAGYTVGGFTDIDGDGRIDDCLVVETPYYAFKLDVEPYRAEKFADTFVEIGTEQLFEISNKDKNFSYDIIWKNNVQNIAISLDGTPSQSNSIDIGIESNVASEYVSVEDTHFSDIKYYDNSWNFWDGVSQIEEISATHDELGPNGVVRNPLWSIDVCSDSHFHTATKLGIQCETTTQIKIPEEIKNNAGWWATDQIDDITFINAIRWLTQEGIIRLDVNQGYSSDPSIPPWIKDTAGWWSEGLVDDETFAMALGYLINKGSIILSLTNSMELTTYVQGDITVTPTDTAGLPDCEPICFEPNSIVIDVNSTVKFSNTHTYSHTFTSGTAFTGPTGLFHSDLVKPGDEFSYTFTEKGTYDYFCIVHPWERGIIIVK